MVSREHFVLNEIVFKTVKRFHLLIIDLNAYFLSVSIDWYNSSSLDIDNLLIVTHKGMKKGKDHNGYILTILLMQWHKKPP